MQNEKLVASMISVQELGERLGISRAKAYELVKSAGFPSIRLGGRIIVPVAQLESWIAQQLEQQAGTKQEER